MKFLKIFFVVMCSCLLLACSKGSEGSEAVFHDLAGNTVQLSKLKGKWVIVNYWASWCHNCADEMPELNSFYKHNTDKNVVMYGVNVDDPSPDDLKEAVQQLNVEFPVLVEDPLNAWNLDSVEGVPMTFIIGPDGKVAKTILGTNSEESLTATLHDLQKDAATSNAKT